MKELLELQARKKKQKAKQKQQVEEFMNTNLGYLTGTLAGQGGVVKHTKPVERQIGDLAQPKGAMPTAALKRSKAS